MLLAIDTSTSQTGLACYDQRGVIAECTWESGRNHTAQVLPQLNLLMRHIQRERSDLRAVVVALGPGSWSGLRVGMSIAKGLALSGGLALIGISTLDALVYQYRQPSLSMYPLIRLGRGRFATAEFLVTDEWRRLSDYRNVSIGELCASIADEAFFCGDIDAEVQDEILRALGKRAFFPEPAAQLRRAGYLAALGWHYFTDGRQDDIARLEPIYLGEPLRA